MKKILTLILLALFISCTKKAPIEAKKELTRLFVEFLPQNDFAIVINIDVKENYMLYESGVNFIIPFGSEMKTPCGTELISLTVGETANLVKLYSAIDFKVKKDSLAGMKTSIENVTGDVLKQHRQFGSWSASEKNFMQEVLRLITAKGNDCLKENATELDIF